MDSPTLDLLAAAPDGPGTPVPTPAQRRAIAAPPGPVLVVAGPGAGKTFCLIERLRHLVEAHGYAPARLCAVTFTNKAAGEIAHRLQGTLGDRAHDVTGGTLHRLCLDVLRSEPGHAGLQPGFGIADEEYQQALVRRLGVPTKRVKGILTLFGRRRLRGAALDPELEVLLGRYLRVLRERNLVDFDDILLLTADLFRDRPDVADRTAARWDAILVDEFQDVSRVQYGILHRLAQPHRHLFAVGDDEQSIYSWAGADSEVLERFRRDFGLGDPIVLDVNRRCSTQIFTAARRLVSRNETLFTKEIQAVRESRYEVEARAFRTEAEEAAWILRDIQADRETTGRAWGDYAVLYRTHVTGDELEGRFLQAGVPCRLARGRALRDDKVVSQVLASLRLILDPRDPAAQDALAALVLPKALRDRIGGLPEAREDFLQAARLVAARSHRSDPDRKKAWRFIYHVENLGSVGRRHGTVHAAADEILAMGMGAYRNPLEERGQELTDPREVEGAEALARRIAAATDAGGQLRFPPMRGLEIALRAMVRSARLGLSAELLPPGTEAGPHDLVLGPDEAEEGGLPVLLFKALQLLIAGGFEETVGDCVCFDVETTGKDVATCEVIEIGAARVRGGVVTDRFHAMVRPTVPIEPGATKVHGYTWADVQAAPGFAEVWDGFRQFVGDDLLVAHNGQEFDIPVLRRQAEGLAGVDDLVFLDTLPVARGLYRESAKLTALAERFGIPTGTSHHALDDAETLAGVVQELFRERARRARIAALSHVLDWLGLGIALAKTGPMRKEKELLLDIARGHTLGRYSDCLEQYAAAAAASPDPETPPVAVVIERLGGPGLMARIRAEKDPAERYPQSVARLRALLAGCEGGTLAEGIRNALERAALSTSEGVEVDPYRVQLLTLHATKGLEFLTVYIVGVEDGQMPGHRTVQESKVEEYPEARRLLYVGMTRAMDRLVLTRVDERAGEPAGGSMFLQEMGLQWAMP